MRILYKLHFIKDVMKVKKIILADDDEDDVLFFKEALQEIDEIELVCVPNEKELVKQLAILPLPDIIFMNKCYHHENEFECIEKLKQDNALQSIPIAIYSDTDHEYYIEEAYKSKASMFIPKPSSFQKIKTVLTKVFEIDTAEIIPQPPRDKFVISV